MPSHGLSPYVSLWKYLDPEPRSLEDTVAEIGDQGFGVEYWPHADTLDPFRAGWGDGFVLFDEEHRDRLAALGRATSSAWHGWLYGPDRNSETPASEEMHRRQTDTAAAMGCSIISVHNLGPALTTEGFDPRGLDLARRILDRAGEAGVTLAMETICPLHILEEMMAALPHLGICLDPAWIHESAPGQLHEFMAACQERLCYLHLYDTGAERGHLPVGHGDVPETDWRHMLLCLQELDFTGPAAFEVFPAPDSGAGSTVEAVQASLRFLDGL